MKSRLLLVVALSVLGSFLLVSTASAQGAPATATADATAEIVGNITIISTAGLNFGQILPSAAPGTVTVDTLGAGLDAGGCTLVMNGMTAAADFTVGGQASATYDIALPATCTLVGPGGAGVDEMTVDNFVDSLGGSGQLDGVGAQTFTVGAILHVPGDPTVGVYDGTFDVSVNYN